VSLLHQYHDPSIVPGHPALDQPPLEVIDGADEYEVEAILNRQTHQQKTQYLVKWKGYHESESTWEPEQNLMNSTAVIAEFSRSGT